MQRPPYSYRDDPNVPVFPDDVPIVVYDGICAMCSGTVRFLLARDGAWERHRFVAAQSPLGEALYRHHGLPTDPCDTFLVLIDGRSLQKSGAALALLAGLGLPWSLLARIGALIPLRGRDTAYDFVARHRYRLWGRHDACLRPPPGTEARFLA